MNSTCNWMTILGWPLASGEVWQGPRDGLGHLTTSVYDDAGHLVETINPDSHSTGQLYDADGNVTGILDADSNLTKYLFNDLGQQTETIDPLSHVSYTYYDEDGNVTETVDALGQSITKTYDADGNLTGVVWKNSGGTVVDTQSYTFDNDDEMLTAANDEGTYTFLYNAAGEVTSVADPFGLTLSMGYDGGGN